MRSLLSLFCLVAVVLAPRAQELTPPETALGHRVGADGFLADYGQLVAWWQKLAAGSDRMRLEDIGRTSYGQTQWVAVLSAPENLTRMDELRAVNRRLMLGRDADAEVAAELAADARAVVWIDAGMHATEAVAAQNILELVWQMVSRDDAEVRRILDQVVLLVCPANPDGMQMIARGYMATGRVGGLPVLYQRYCGHDNNRDHYTGNVAETRNIQRMLYRRWLPQVVYNHHQSAPRGTIIFTPPFRDPFNFNIDPLVIRGIELVAAHINHRFASEGKPGVISRSGAPYSTWWNGGLRTTVYFHNQIGILTEVFGRPDPTPLRPRRSRRLPHSDYPDPIAETIWHPRQTIDYLQTANFAILDVVARYRERFQLDGWRMARRSIARGSGDHWTATPRLLELAERRAERRRELEQSGEREGPAADLVEPFEDPDLRDARHYLLAGDQPDFAAATRLVRRLRRGGIEVHRLTRPVELPGRTAPAPAGSFVIHAAQAFRPHLRDMLEPQWHPDDRTSEGTPVRPYDSAGWTLSLQMGVAVERLRDARAFPAAEPVTAVEVPFLPAAFDADAAAGWLLHPADGNRAIAVNRLLEQGAQVAWLPEGCAAADRRWPAGTAFVSATPRSAEVLADCAQELGVAAVAVDDLPSSAPLRTAQRSRVGLFDIYGGHMATGWTQWALETFEFASAELVFGERIEAGALAEDFDVLVFATGLPPATERARRRAALRRGRGATTSEAVRALQSTLPPFEDWSTIEARRVRLSEEHAVPALREFVDGGGRIVGMGDEAMTLARHFDLPVAEGIEVDTDDGGSRRATSQEFYVPGSLLRLHVDAEHPLAWGVHPRQVAVFRRGDVHRVTDAGADVEIAAHYADAGEVLASGWAIGVDRLAGRPAVLRAPLGRGDLVLFGPDVMYRGQPTGTFKFLFNAIQTAPGAE